MHPRLSLLVFGAFLGLMVALPSLAAAASAITVKVQPAADGAAQVTAKVTDAKGAPVADTTVTLREKTTFGWLTLGEVQTDRAGVGTFFVPSPLPQEIAVEAEGEEGTVQASVWLGERPSIPLRARPDRTVLRRLSPQPGFMSPYPPPQLIILGLILGGIWTTYGYLVFQLIKIRRASGHF